jgi:hypothetical protein
LRSLACRAKNGDFALESVREVARCREVKEEAELLANGMGEVVNIELLRGWSV